MTHKALRRYPLEPLITWLTVNFPHDHTELFEVENNDGKVVETRISNERAAELLASTRKNITVYRREGIPELIADDMATHLGLHPRNFWPDIYDAPIDLPMTVHQNRRAKARKLLAQGLSIEHLDSAPKGRQRAS